MLVPFPTRVSQLSTTSDTQLLLQSASKEEVDQGLYDSVLETKSHSLQSSVRRDDVINAVVLHHTLANSITCLPVHEGYPSDVTNWNRKKSFQYYKYEVGFIL